jgi:maltodextrin utilization protein YvdJ
LFLTITEEVVPFVIELFKVAWPFIIGCAIGVPLSLAAQTKIIGNAIVAISFVGNVLWLAYVLRKR